MEENEPSHKTIVVISKVLYLANPYSNPITGNCNFTTRTSVCTERATTSLTNGQLYTCVIGLILFMSGAMLTLSVTTYIMRMLIWRSADKESKDAILRLQSIISLFLTLMLCSIGIYHSHNIQINYVTIPISGLDRSLNGTTIVQLSDIHMGPFIGRSHVEAVVRKANKLNGDIVTITSDLIDSSVSNLWEAAKPLEHLNAKYGTYYTTG